MKIYKTIFLLFFISFSLNASEPDDNNEPFFLSSDFGSVKTSYTYPGDRLIYHIHDAHCKADAQLNIANIIENIINHHSSVLIAVEGASGAVIAENFRQFPDKKVLDYVSKYFLDKGFIAGSEYYLLNSPKPLTFIGIENPEIYKKNYELILESIHAQPEAISVVNSLISEQAVYCDFLLSETQKNFLSYWIAYNKHELTLDKYIEYLVLILGTDNKYESLTDFLRVINEENNIDFNIVEKQRLKFLDWITSNADKDIIKEIFKWDIRYKLNKITAKTYFKKFIGWVNEYETDFEHEEYAELKKYTDLLFYSEKINKTKLYAELNEAVDESARIVFCNEKDFLVFDLIQRTYLYKSLIGLSINYEKFKSLSEQSGFSEFTLALKSVFPSIKIDTASITSLEKAVEVSLLFYQQALKREFYMVENCLNEMEKQRINVGIIVTGGFHEQGISDELNRRKVSFCSIEPAIKDTSVETSYFSLVQNFRSPLENWVAGSTLAVASWIAETPLVDNGIKEVRTHIFSSLLTADYVRELSPSNIERIKEQLDLLIAQANVYLSNWRKAYAPEISLGSVEIIGNKLAVHVNVGNRELVYLFSEPKIPETRPVSGQDTLEEGKIAQYRVEAVAGEFIDKLRQIARAEHISGRDFYSEKDVKNIVIQLGIQTEFENNQLSLSLIDLAVKDYNYRNDRTLSLSQLYNLYKYIIDDFLTDDDIKTISGMTGENITGSQVSELNPRELLDECYSMLRNSYHERPVIRVDNLSSNWRRILSDRGISDILVDPTLPFESLVVMMFYLAFSPELEPGTMYIGAMSGKRYFIRLIKLTDGKLFARVGHRNLFSTESLFWSEAEYEKQSQLPLPLDEGLITLEVDGGFVLSSVIKIDRRTLKTKATEIRTSINGIMRGADGASQLRELLEKHRDEAIKFGLYPTGFIIRNQENEPLYFSDIDSLLIYFREIKGTNYEPVRQSDWTKTAGSFKSDDFERIATSNSIRYSDAVDPVNIFEQLNELIPIEGSRILDVGSQTGQNIFYFYLKGAEFSTGLDFNPYNVMIAREISAYIHENEETSGKVGFDEHNLSEFAVMENGPSKGHLYFRTAYLKTIEDQENRQVSNTPPKNIEFAIGDARHIQYPADSFDISNAVNLLQYIDNASLALKEMIRVTRPGGFVQFNYGMLDRDNIDLVQEAVRLLERDEGLTVSYKLIEFPESVFPLPLYVIHIQDKSPLLDLSGEVDFIKNHEYKRTFYENDFDSKPYLGAIYPPVNIVPRELNIIAQGNLRDVHNINGLPNRRRFNLTLVKTLMNNIYGADIFSGLKDVQIEKGRNSFVYVLGNTLVINEVALDNPLILFMRMEQELAANTELSGIYDLQSDSFFPLYRDVASVYRSLLKMKDRLTTRELEYLIWSLRASDNPDTDLEMESIMLGNLLEASADPETKSSELISKIIDGLVSLPRYDYLNLLLPQTLQQGKIKPSLFAAVVRLAQEIDDNTREMEGFSYFINKMAVHSVNSEQPLETIDALFNIFPWMDKLSKSSKLLPYNLENIFDNKNVGKILASYSVAGNIIIEDLIKTYLDNPLYSSAAPFLAKLSSVEIKNVIENLENYYSQTPDLILETLVKAEELSKVRTVKSVRDALVGSLPLDTITNQLELKITDENFDADRHFANFLPYFELLMLEKSKLPSNLVGFTDMDKIDEIYSTYSGTGFYIATELAKTYFNKPDEPSELPFLSEFTDQEIFRLIENIDTFIRHHAGQNKYASSITSPLYLPVSAWIVPRLHNYLIQENGGKPYEIIEVNTRSGVDTVEGMDALFNEISIEVEANEIDPETVVLLKISDYYVTADDVPVHTFILVADKLKNIYSKSEIARIRMESGAHLGVNLFEFKIHYMPDSNEIGDVTVVDYAGDERMYDWYIAIAKEDERSRGIGSEFLRNYFSMLQYSGLNGTRVQSTAHAVSMLKLLGRELNSEFDEKLSDNMVGNFEETYLKFSGLLFRLGILNESELNLIQTNSQNKDWIKSILDNSIENALMPGESQIGLFVRKSDELTANTIRMEKIINAYSVLVNNDFVKELLPSIKDDYARLEPFINLRKTENMSFHDINLLTAENNLFSLLPELEENLTGYFRDNPSNVLDSYMYLLDFEPDSREIFNDINKYFEQSFSYTSIRGNIPISLNEANLSFIARMILTRSLPLTTEFPLNIVKQALLADEPVKEIDSKLSELETLAKARILLKDLLRNITRFEQSQWRKTIISEILGYILELGMPVKPFLSSDKDYMDMFLAQPYGAWRLMAYIVSNNLKEPEETKKLINRLKLLDTDKFKLVLDMLESGSQARAIKKSFPEFVSLVSKGIITSIQNGRADFGRLILLSAEGVAISGDTSVAGNMVLKGFTDETPAKRGYNLYEKAFEVVDLLAENNIKATVVKGRINPDAPFEHFVKTGDFIISVKPYGHLFVESLFDETQSSRIFLSDDALPFSDEPLLWHSISDKQGLLFKGGINLNTRAGDKYFDITISALDIQNNKQTGEQTYLLRIPAERLLDFYYSAVSEPETDITELSRSFGDIYFGLQNENGDLTRLNLYSHIFNESFYEIIQNLDPEWIISFITNEAVSRINSIPDTEVQSRLNVIPYSSVSYGVKQALLELQYNQSDKSKDKDTLLRTNESKTDFNVIFFDGIPIGAVEKENIFIIQNTIPENIRGFIGETAVHLIATSMDQLRRNNNIDRVVLPLVNFKFNDRLDWVVDPLAGFSASAVDTDKLKSELETALADVNYHGESLSKLNVSFRIVEGSSRLAERPPALPGGSVIVSIDIDAFRNRSILGFVLQHVMRDVSANNLESYISNEIVSLIKDLRYFQGLPADEQNQITSVLRNDDVALVSFADLLDNMSSLSQEDIIRSIISYVADRNVYPQFSSVFNEMNFADIARLVSSQLNPVLSQRLLQSGYSPFETLFLITQPYSNNIESIAFYFDKLNENNKYGLSQNIVPDVFLGRFSRSDISGLLSVFYSVFDNIALLSDESDAQLALWADLFSRLGIDSITELLKTIDNNKNRYLLAKKILEIMENQSENILIDSFSTDDANVIEVIYQHGNNNVSLKYSMTGELLSRDEVERISYEKLLPQLIHEQTELTEHFFGSDIEFLIGLMERMLELKVGDDLFIDNFAAVKSIFEELSDKYNTYPRAGVLAAPVSRQEAMKSVVYQFASDLIGTPLASARVAVDLASFFKEEDKKLANIKKSIELLRQIRENLVRFRMMREFYISNQQLPMMVFTETFKKPENQPFQLHNFSMNADLEKAIKQELDKSSENTVYAVVCEGKNPSSLVWISTLQRNIADKPGNKIAVVSTVLGSAQLEDVLSSAGIDISDLVILGNEVINIELPEEGNEPDIINKLVSLVSVNCRISEDKLVFLSSEVDVVGKFLNYGINILPMPDIKQTPLPVRKKFPSMDIYENAA